MKYDFKGILKLMVSKGLNGNPEDVDFIMDKLTADSIFAITRYVDFALSLVEKPEGIERIKYYLFHGTQIQRNYACLFLNRRGDWKTVKEAFEKGLIDAIQAYSH